VGLQSGPKVEARALFFQQIAAKAIGLAANLVKVTEHFSNLGSLKIPTLLFCQLDGSSGGVCHRRGVKIFRVAVGNPL
jgi:hypothetical protein